MSVNIIDELCSGVGLLYITDETGTVFYSSGVTNNSNGLELIKKDALIRAGEGFATSGVCTYTFTSISAPDTITDFTIDGVSQIDIASPIVVDAGLEEVAAQDLATAINAFIPATGVNYKAFAVGNITYAQAVTPGSNYNGDAVILSQGTGNITGTATAVADGSDGGEAISECVGRKYWLNPNTTANTGSLTGATEITQYVVMRGIQSSIYTHSQTISGTSITDLPRYSLLSTLELGAGSATDLDSITGDFSLYDILIISNKSAYTIDINDLSAGTGNIKLASTTPFSMVNDNYVLGLMYINDATYGYIWQELWRTPLTLAADSVTSTELANLSVGTSELQGTSVTTAKIALANITNALMAVDSVGTSNIVDLNVTTAKINDLAVTTAKIALLAVDTGQINDLAVTTAKIEDGAVTTDKVDTNLKTELITVPVVFSADYYGQVKVELPYDCSVIKISAAVTKLIEATDDAIIIPKNNSGTAMTSGQIDMTAAAPIGNVFTSSPSGNNTFTANQNLILEISKATDGGEALVSIHILRS